MPLKVELAANELVSIVRDCQIKIVVNEDNFCDWLEDMRSDFEVENLLIEIRRIMV